MWLNLTEIFWEEKRLELAFEGWESNRVPDVLVEYEVNNNNNHYSV